MSAEKSGELSGSRVVHHYTFNPFLSQHRHEKPIDNIEKKIESLKEAHLPKEQYVYFKKRLTMTNKMSFQRQNPSVRSQEVDAPTIPQKNVNQSEHYTYTAAKLLKQASSSKSATPRSDSVSLSEAKPTQASSSEIHKASQLEASTAVKQQSPQTAQARTAAERMHRALHPSDHFKAIYDMMCDNNCRDKENVTFKSAGAGVNGAQFVIINGIKQAVIKPIQPKVGILRQLEIWGKAALKLERPANYIGPPEFKGINEEAFFGLACVMGLNDPPDGPVPETRMILYQGQYYTMQLFAEGNMAKSTRESHPHLWSAPGSKRDPQKMDEKRIQQAQNAALTDLICNQLDRHHENFLVSVDEQGKFKDMKLIDSGACLIKKNLKASHHTKLIRRNLNQWKDMQIMQNPLTEQTQEKLNAIDIQDCQEYLKALRNNYELRMLNYINNLLEKQQEPSKQLLQQHKMVMKFFKGVNEYKPQKSSGSRHHIPLAAKKNGHQKPDTSIQKKLRILESNINIYRDLAQTPGMTLREMAKMTETDRQKTRLLMEIQEP